MESGVCQIWSPIGGFDSLIGVESAEGVGAELEGRVGGDRVTKARQVRGMSFHRMKEVK